MKLTNFDSPVMSSWFDIKGARLDSRPYLSGALEARVQLEKLRVKKLPLISLTKGYSGGIYNGPQFVRNYVDSEEHGVPFLTSGTMLLADLSKVGLLRKKDALSSKLSYLRLEEGMTLISCSGTIGRMVYAGPYMNDVWSSQDVLKVVPDPDKILPGYLYAYLSSKFGVPQVIEGTYGAIIPHLEPHHIAQLPIPRLGSIETTIHNLCDTAAKLRTEASTKLRVASDIINEHFEFPKKLALSHRNFSVTAASSNTLEYRMIGAFYIAAAQESDRLLAQIKKLDILGNLISSVGETGRLKQLFVSEEYGVPFLTSSEIFRLDHKPTRFIAKHLIPNNDDWTVKEEDLLLARSGQVGGIIGRGVWADPRIQGNCVSVHVLRLRAKRQDILPGYLFAYLFLTDVGYRQLVRFACGSSIPYLSASDILSIRVPRTTSEVENAIHDLVRDAGMLRAEAQANEDEARKMIEQAIEEGAKWQPLSQ